jgi:hypothetical protein
MKLGQKVKIEGTNITGVITGKIKWENPLSAFNKKGVDYLVEDGNGETHRVNERRVYAI